MFIRGAIVKVLISNIPNAGYDYRLPEPADIGTFVSVNVMNRPCVGIIWGPGDSNLPPNKIKDISIVHPSKLSVPDMQWIKKMSDWTLIPLGMVLRLIVNIPDAFSPPRMEQLYAFNFESDVRMTSNRLAVSDAFASNENESMTITDIQNIAHVSNAVIRTMIKNGTLIPSGTQEKPTNTYVAQYVDSGNIVLNSQQQSAADIIGDAIKSGEFSVHLLDGITGSGKTQVYFDSAWRAYSAGKSVLLMMPEIALTAQFMTRFKSRFGAAPVVWHSNLTAARRRQIWRGVLNGKIKMVVGTRSALFLPWQDLGLIVIDEEHDSSYKQEDMGNYHARDMAVLRAKIAGFPVVLASATPAAETLENVSLGKYKHLRLTSRFGGAQLPSIDTIDLRENRPTPYIINDEEQAGFLSPRLCDAISETLSAGQQTLLFINRRGFAPITQCKKCGWTATCPDCSVGMTYHQRIGKLLCHMCGRTTPLPKACPDCGADVSMRGVGLEKIEQEVHARFPTARTALVSSDIITSRQSLERLVNRMEQGEIDIVIGTQILAKGHHFPNLTLVGVVDADMGLFGTDFRAAEHTFQQLFQVAGRAGRGEFPGRVLLQSYQPTHPVLTAICAGNRDSFMEMDMAGRRAAQMPPYGQLIAVIVEGEKERVLQNYCAALAAAAPVLNGAKIMGPITAQIYQIRNWYRMRFLVAGPASAALQPAVSHWLAKVKQPANIRVKIDVNPINFL
ncbi:MAG: primosomal protein N' [Alphaproteobacteria bacterium]|nr:primosomal protein N' [Alphaproteobacteria bacterium]MBR6598036.1 primosomal protein N' [Alphaproteobacteria bacterium]